MYKQLFKAFAYNELPPHLIVKDYYKNIPKLSLVTNLGDLENLRTVSKVAGKALEEMARRIKKGDLKNGNEVDNFFIKFAIQHRCFPSSFGFMGFPKSLCISPNDGNHILK